MCLWTYFLQLTLCNFLLLIDLNRNEHEVNIHKPIIHPSYSCGSSGAWLCYWTVDLNVRALCSIQSTTSNIELSTTTTKLSCAVNAAMSVKKFSAKVMKIELPSPLTYLLASRTVKQDIESPAISKLCVRCSSRTVNNYVGARETASGIQNIECGPSIE